MSEKKKLNDEQLEEVNGGLIFVNTRYPVASDFYDQVGDRVSFYTFYPNGDAKYIECEVVGLGYRVTGTKFDRIFADLYYKMQTVNRSLSQFDGWYGSKEPLSGERKKTSEDGIVTVA